MKKRILLVDDEADIRDLLKRVLIRDGFEVCAATSGADAKSMVKEAAPDLIITDFQMEDTDGFSLITELRQSLPETPVIMLTGVIFDAETIEERISKQGLVYIPKTAPLLQIQNEVRRLLA